MRVFGYSFTYDEPTRDMIIRGAGGAVLMLYLVTIATNPIFQYTLESLGVLLGGIVLYLIVFQRADWREGLE